MKESVLNEIDKVEIITLADNYIRARNAGCLYCEYGWYNHNL